LLIVLQLYMCYIIVLGNLKLAGLKIQEDQIHTFFWLFGIDFNYEHIFLIKQWDRRSCWEFIMHLDQTNYIVSNFCKAAS
jgi:hypothetical protein